MVSFYYYDLYKLCKEHKSHFQEKSDQFFRFFIDPNWKDGGCKKLVFDEVDQDHILVQFYNGITINIIEDAENFIGGGSHYRRAFIFFMFSDLEKMTRKFDLRGLKSLNIKTGFRDIFNLNPPRQLKYSPQMFEVVAFLGESHINYYENASPSFISVARSIANKGELSCEGERRFVQWLEENIEISSINDILSDGFFTYINETSPAKIPLPKTIKNNLDFSIWKTMLKNIKITEKNVDEIMYYDDYLSIRSYKDQMLEHIKIAFPKIFSRRYFWKFY